ncbi:MAG: methyl-viologen-reducing hydrogenase subunit delta [Candidatus Syntrophoarchaeum caldarius]|uniref:Methyl-viologen-reducing hydrogenase subunit delta n=1 Tax=Candidatus Syntropharchaeum caldarium TaxID=1838285 RepID=A0A1F2PAX3_9EURY|nr:MAG: methyl-viologen-reducing hydrogenase subunit delta [Candidatus Syntrophoarchaeum caldarius]
MTFEPKIIGFCCNSCSYAAADRAGVEKRSYPSNLRIIRLPCSGKTDVMHILKAFEMGADGVFVAACMDGRCLYLNGNNHAKRRVEILKGHLKTIGLGEERLEVFQLEAAGKSFAEIVEEFTETVKKLGVNPLAGK